MNTKGNMKKAKNKNRKRSRNTLEWTDEEGTGDSKEEIKQEKKNQTIRKKKSCPATTPVYIRHAQATPPWVLKWAGLKSSG